jgi:hypothetical protein
MTFLQGLGAVTGVLGGIAVFVAALTNRSQGGRSFAHDELVDAFEALKDRVDRAERAEARCQEDLKMLTKRIAAIECKP